MVFDKDNIVKMLYERLSDLPNFVKAVLLFGSMARGEAYSRSDIDLLILHKDLPISDLIKRRRYLYKLVMDRVNDLCDAVTLLDMELNDFLYPKVITSLLLNIYWDAIIILDRMHEISRFLKYIRRRIREVGLVRIKDNRAYCWILPKPMQKIELL